MDYPQFRQTFQHDYYVLAAEILLLKLPNLKHMEIEDSSSFHFRLFEKALPTQRAAILALVPAVESVTIFTTRVDCINIFIFGILLRYIPSIVDLTVKGPSERGMSGTLWANMDSCPRIQ